MKKSLHFSKEDISHINYLGKLLEFGDIKTGYGTIPKVMKFGNTLSIEMIKLYEKVIPDLKTHELDKFFQAIKNLRSYNKQQKTIQEMRKL